MLESVRLIALVLILIKDCLKIKDVTSRCLQESRSNGVCRNRLMVDLFAFAVAMATAVYYGQELTHTYAVVMA